MLRLALQTMRSRLHGFVGAFVALTLAAAIVTACGVLLETGARAGAPVERYTGTPVVVSGEQSVEVEVDGEEEAVRLPEPARIPAALARDLAAIDGVRAVIADRSLPATVATTSGRFLLAQDGEPVRAHGWRSAQLTPYELTAGRPPSFQREVVLDGTLARRGGVALGDDISITSTDGTENYEIVGLASPPRRVGWQGAVFLSEARAESLSADPTRVEALGVLLDNGIDLEELAMRIERALGESVAAYVGDDRRKVDARASVDQNEDLVGLAGAFGSFAAILSIFVVAATLGLSMLQRAREIALLRTVGAKPRQIRRLLVGEAMIVALAAGLAGVAPGVLLASVLFEALQSQGIGTETTALVIGPLPPAIAVGIGLVTAALAAWLAGRRAARIRPTAALAEAALEPKRIGWVRLLLGLGFVAGGATLSATALSLEGEAAALASFVVMILMVAVGLLGPLLARIAAAVFGPSVASLFPTSGFLAMANVRTRARRFASASTPIALGVAISLALIGTVAVEASATEKQSRDRVLADRVLAAPGGLPSRLGDQVRGLPGVAAVTDLLPTQVAAVFREFDGSRFEYLPAVGASPRGLDETLELDVREGSVAELPANGVAVSVDRARSLDVGVGDEVSLWLGDGRQITPRLVATYASTLGFGDVVLPRARVAAHVADPMDTLMLVEYDEHTAVENLDARLVALAERMPGLQVLDRADLQAAQTDEAESDAWVNYLMIGVLMVFVAIAAVNSLVMAVGERTPELALLRIVGATPRQVTRMTRCETLAVIGFGVVIGLAVAAATLVPFSRAIADTLVPSLPWEVVSGVVAGAVVLGLGASEVATRNALRQHPLEVIGTNE